MKPLRYLSTFSLLAGLAIAQHGKQSSDFSGLAANTTVQVVIQFNGLSNSSLLSAIAGKGATQIKAFKHVHAAVFKLPAGIANLITALPFVKYVSIDRQVQSHDAVTNATVNANLAQQYGWTGQGIGVAVIDSGVSPHRDLLTSSGASRIVYSQSFVANDSSTADASISWGDSAIWTSSISWGDSTTAANTVAHGDKE